MVKIKDEIKVSPKEMAQYAIDYVIDCGRLYRNVYKRRYLVIPQKVRWRLTKACQFGLDKTRGVPERFLVPKNDMLC